MTRVRSTTFPSSRRRSRSSSRAITTSTTPTRSRSGTTSSIRALTWGSPAPARSAWDGGPRTDRPVPVRHHLRQPWRRRIHVVWVGAVHAVQSPPIQHVPGPGQPHVVRQESLDYRGRERREISLRQFVLLRRPERLYVQLARRFLRGRQWLPGQSEPDRRASYGATLRGQELARAR